MSPSELSRTRRRTDSPDPMSRLIVLLAVIVGTLAIVSSGVAAFAIVRLEVQQHEIERNLADSKARSANTVSAFCDAINGNAKAANRGTDYLRALIITGAKQGRAFEQLYVSHGFPPYPERLAQAIHTADGLRGRAIPVLNCKRLVLKVKRNDPRP